MASPSRITPDRVVIAAALLAALAYIQDLRYDFILDDVPLILINETLRSWHNWKTIFLTNIFNTKSQALPFEIAALGTQRTAKLSGAPSAARGRDCSLQTAQREDRKAV